MIDQPCGETHVMSCGLDPDCPVPIDFYNATRSNKEIVEAWQESDAYPDPR